MSKKWPVVPLGQVVKYRKEFIYIDDLQIYKRCRVQLHAQGIVLRDTVSGSEIKTKKQQVCRAGELLVAEIDAKVGGYGIVPEELDGAIVSSHYFLFQTDEIVLDKRFLNYFIRTPAFRNQVLAQGSTNYAAIRPNDVFGYKIPLPSISEQRRIVARIEELTAKIEEAQTFRRQAREEMQALLGLRAAGIFRVALRSSIEPLGTVASLERGKFSHRPRNDPHFFEGLHPWIQIAEIESSNKFIRRWSQTLNDEGLAISKKFPRGTLLISIAATIGAVGILDFDCCVPDSIVGVTPREGMGSEFIYHYLGYIRSHLEEIAPRSAQKNINLQILSELPVPRLPLHEQNRIAAELDRLQTKVDALKLLQAETSAELDALLPAVLDKAFKGEF